MRIDLFDKYDVIFFDLDDTIYPEIEYLKRAYRFIAESVVKKEESALLDVEDIYIFLINCFFTEGRQNLYQKLFTRFNLKCFSIEDFFSCLRGVHLNKNELEVFPLIHDIIKILVKKHKLLFIITNGNELQQQNKINSLNIPLESFKEVIYASKLGKEYEKPNPFFLKRVIEDYSLQFKKVLFIGDSDNDKEAAEQAEISFIYKTSLKVN